MPAPFTVQPPLDLNAAELQLRYVMFQQEWDLGEDLAVSASSSKITVSGTASSDDRAAEMRSVLGKLPGVEIAIAGPGDGAPRAGAGKRPRSSSQPVRSSPPLLKDVLDQSFPSRTERLAFVDDCLSSSDLEVSHAWALKRLSDRYNEASVRAWNGELRAKLREMLEVHSEKVGALNHGALDSLQALLPDAQPRKFAAPGDWHQAVLDLFTQVQEQDALVAALVAGTQNGERDLAAAAGRYRSAHRSVGSAADALTSLAGAQR